VVGKSKLDENRLRRSHKATGGIICIWKRAQRCGSCTRRAFETKDRRNRCAAFESANRALRMAAAGAMSADRLPVHHDLKTVRKLPRRSPVKREVLVAASLLFVAAAEVTRFRGSTYI